jgi:hypothetical protein
MLSRKGGKGPAVGQNEGKEAGRRKCLFEPFRQVKETLGRVSRVTCHSLTLNPYEAPTLAQRFSWTETAS